MPRKTHQKGTEATKNHQLLCNKPTNEASGRQRSSRGNKRPARFDDYETVSPKREEVEQSRKRPKKSVAIGSIRKSQRPEKKENCVDGILDVNGCSVDTAPCEGTDVTLVVKLKDNSSISLGQEINVQTDEKEDGLNNTDNSLIDNSYLKGDTIKTEESHGEVEKDGSTGTVDLGKRSPNAEPQPSEKGSFEETDDDTVLSILDSVLEDSEESVVSNTELPKKEEKPSLPDKYKCPYCDFKSPTRLFAPHIKEAHPEYMVSVNGSCLKGAKYKCPKCKVQLGRICRLTDHMSKCKKENADGSELMRYSCAYCQEKFINTANASKHMEKEHSDMIVIKSEGNKNYRCPACRGCYASIGAIKAHLKTCPDVHLRGAESGSQEVIGLGQIKTAYPIKVVTHPSASKHRHSKAKYCFEECQAICLAKQPFRCGFCKKEFKHHSVLVLHEKTHYQGSREMSGKKVLDPVDGISHQCNQCDEKFDTAAQLSKHVGSVHAGSHYKCSKCAETFAEHQACLKHTISCRIEGLSSDALHFYCNTCKRNFFTQSRLDKHMEKIHNFVCEDCGERFELKRYMEKHLSVVHGKKKPVAMEKCPQCDQVLPKSSMDIHIISKHSHARRYKCSYCPKTFKFRSSCSSHMLIHKNKRRWACPICHLTFTQQSTLSNHLLRYRIHGNMQIPDVEKWMKEGKYKKEWVEKVEAALKIPVPNAMQQQQRIVENVGDISKLQQILNLPMEELGSTIMFIKGDDGCVLQVLSYPENKEGQDIIEPGENQVIYLADNDVGNVQEVENTDKSSVMYTTMPVIAPDEVTVNQPNIIEAAALQSEIAVTDTNSDNQAALQVPVDSCTVFQ